MFSTGKLTKLFWGSFSAESTVILKLNIQHDHRKALQLIIRNSVCFKFADCPEAEKHSRRRHGPRRSGQEQKGFVGLDYRADRCRVKWVQHCLGFWVCPWVDRLIFWPSLETSWDNVAWDRHYLDWLESGTTWSHLRKTLLGVTRDDHYFRHLRHWLEGLRQHDPWDIRYLGLLSHSLYGSLERNRGRTAKLPEELPTPPKPASSRWSAPSTCLNPCSSPSPWMA